MVKEEIKKLTLVINTVILVLVFGLMAFFYICKASFLVWFSWPTAAIYLVGYYLIFKDKLDQYVRLVYGWLTLYMSITTICLGYGFGFHLYSMSMIPIIFYTEYMAFKLNTKKINTLLYSILVIASYLITTGYSVFMTPIYETDPRIAGVFWITNSIIVLGFVTVYSRILVKMTIASETMLSERANKDQLTHLYNRHYMMELLKEAYDSDEAYNIAMIDIDNFKSVNDKYGHGAGDAVLCKVASVMKEICCDSSVSRWGGEEFLILTRSNVDLIEKLRQAVEDMSIETDGHVIKVTLTAGFEAKDKEVSLDRWIVSADEKLYFGKNNGKNRVIT